MEESSGLLQAVQETVISPRQVKHKLGIFFGRHISEPLISVARQEEAERWKEAGDEEEENAVLSRDEAEDEEKKEEEEEEEEEEKRTRDDAKTA